MGVVRLEIPEVNEAKDKDQNVNEVIGGQERHAEDENEANDAIKDESEEQEPELRPDEVDELSLWTEEEDNDLISAYPITSEELDLVHSRLTSLEPLKIHRWKSLSRLYLRNNFLRSIPEDLPITIVELDLYDNHIAHAPRAVQSLTNLTILDYSFNSLKHIKHLDALTKLEELYLVQNKINSIANLESLTSLKMLELGANKIREIENLENLVALQQLWLGKNKITSMKNLSCLKNLKILSLPSNRLTVIEGIDELESLEELYLSHNAIEKLQGLDKNSKLTILDISNNRVSLLENISHLSNLEEFWASNNQLSSYPDVQRELGPIKTLKTVYLEGNPLQTESMATYRNKLHLILPSLIQIDASYITTQF